MFGLGKKSKAVVGLDIGSSAVKAVELKPAGKGFKVGAFAIEPVPPDSIVDGAIIDGGAVADAIRRVFERKTFKTKDVAASLSGNAVIVKKISLPVMTEAELAESIYWEAEQYIPFDIQDVNLDYQILDPGTGADSKGTMEVLLVAAKKEKIADYTGVITQAGRVPVVVDVDAFALQNAYEANYGREPGAVVVLLNAGASAININILSGDQSLFTRDISIGGNAYTEAVQKELSLPFERAEQAKKGQSVDGVSFDEVRPVLHAMTENVLLEIQKTFDFFKATAASDRIDRILLSGGACAGRRLRAGARRALRARRSRCSIRSRRSRSTRRSSASRRRSSWCRQRRWPSVSRSGRRATDDSRSTCSPSSARRPRRGSSLSERAEADGRLRADPASRPAWASAGATGRCRSSRRSSTSTFRPPQKETQRLHSIIAQVQQFEQRKAQLQQRVALIEQLRRDQTGPGAHARSDQPLAAADAVAHRISNRARRRRK